MLVWSMRCGSVLLLGLIGIEGTRVFRKNCSVATIRFAKTKIPTSVQLFCDCGLLSVLREAEMGRCASDLPLFRASIRVLTSRGNSQSQKSCNFGRISVFGHPDRPHAGAMGGVACGRGAFVDDFGQRCGRGGLGSAVRGCLWWRNVGGWMPWTTRRREWSGPGVTPLVALETLRVGAWSSAAGRHKKCLRLLASVREGKSICWAACWRFALLLVSGFFACRIRGRSYPHSIAAPSVLRYHDKNYFKRALKCICVQNKQEKAPSILKKGRIHGFSHLC